MKKLARAEARAVEKAEIKAAMKKAANETKQSQRDKALAKSQKVI